MGSLVALGLEGSDPLAPLVVRWPGLDEPTAARLTACGLAVVGAQDAPVVVGTRHQFEYLAAREGLPQDVLRQFLGRGGACLWHVGSRHFSADQPILMGIVNVTPDSFSDGGAYLDPARAVDHALQLVDAGAAIIDLGAESTRPDHQVVPADEEWRRLEPVLKALASRLRVPISVDTSKAFVAERALDVGAQIINDVWGLSRDEAMAPLVARYEASLVLMHNQAESNYTDLVGEVHAFLRHQLDYAQQTGIDPQRVVLDPGIGFGKTAEQNIEMLRRLPELADLGRPMLVGLSRKRFIGALLGGLPVTQRQEGTEAAHCYALTRGAAIFRVHDVLAARRTLSVFEPLWKA